jgi:hypothetical protein
MTVHVGVIVCYAAAGDRKCMRLCLEQPDLEAFKACFLETASWIMHKPMLFLRQIVRFW